ncbi:hypothetical protein HDU67_000189, partial [Dinochytrium kinnereticum]
MGSSSRRPFRIAICNCFFWLKVLLALTIAVSGLAYQVLLVVQYRNAALNSNNSAQAPLLSNAPPPPPVAAPPSAFRLSANLNAWQKGVDKIGAASPLSVRVGPRFVAV